MVACIWFFNLPWCSDVLLLSFSIFVWRLPFLYVCLVSLLFVVFLVIILQGECVVALSVSTLFWAFFFHFNFLFCFFVFCLSFEKRAKSVLSPSPPLLTISCNNLWYSSFPPLCTCLFIWSLCSIYKTEAFNWNIFSFCCLSTWIWNELKKRWMEWCGTDWNKWVQEWVLF